MVEDRITDGRRIAELLASEIEGRTDGDLGRFAVSNANHDVEPTVDGARAYDLVRIDGENRTGGDDRTEEGDRFDENDQIDEGDRTEKERQIVEGGQFARVFVHPDRVHVEFGAGRSAAVEAAERAGLRVRPKATRPPKTLVFVESGAEVKRVIDVVAAAGRSVENA